MARTKADSKRESLREQLWPHQSQNTWTGPSEKGYWCAPRVLPLLLDLVRTKKITGGLDCSSVYLELLSRDFGQGIVEILDDDEHAFCSGYRGNRAKRTWQERIRRLEASSIIATRPKGNKAIGYILLFHPYKVAAELRARRKVDDAWWQLFLRRVNDVGAGETLQRFLEVGSPTETIETEAAVDSRSG